jgi:hypothetical protein
MAAQRTYEGVNAGTWARMKAVGASRHGTSYEPETGNRGIATTRTPLGTFVVAFDFDDAGQRITYTIVDKPMLVTSGLIWSSLGDTLEECRER